METVEIIGLVAGCLTTSAFLPQVKRTLALRSARDLRAAMLVLFIAGVCLRLAYAC
jgi:MtN3 and saliva related transmembrane protein